MNKFSIAVVGATVLAVSPVNRDPAEAAQLTNLKVHGNVTVSSDDLPLFNEPETIERTVNAEVIIDNLAGRLEDEEDSHLTFPIIGYLNEYLPELFSDLPVEISLATFSGQGSIYGDAAKSNPLSKFSWSYNQDDDIVTVDGYDFSSIEICLTATCYLSGESEQLSVSVPGMPLSMPAEMSFDVAQTATLLPMDTSQPPGIQSFNVSDANTESVPEPLTILGSVTALGFGTLFKREHSRRQRNRTKQ